MKKLLLPFLLILLCSMQALAQVSTAQLSGQVLDDRKQPVGSVTVILHNLGTNQTRGAVTNEKGFYNIVGIQPGSYELTAQHVSYHKSTVKTQLTIGQDAVIDFNLVPSEVQLETVEVVSNASRFELTKTDISTTVRSEQIMLLPMDSRNVLTLAEVSPGVKSYAPVGGQTLPASGAVSSYNFINLVVNGSEWKTLFNGNIVGLGQTGSPVPQDAIQEFKVILNAYDAEYTRGGSYIISALTKRGTNEFKMTAFGSIQNKGLLARGPFQTTVPDYNRQQSGISISGPIQLNKTFFAATYELQNINNYVDVIPGKPAYNPGIWSKYAGTFESPRVNHIAAFSLTHYLNDQNILDLTWNTRYTDAKFYFGGIVAKQAGLHGTYKVNDIGLKHTYMLSSSAMNELSVQYLSWRHDEPTMTTGPSLIYPSIQLGRGDFPIQLSEDHIGIIDKFTITMQDHVLKAGLEARNIDAKPWFPYYKDGQFNFRTDTSALPYQAVVGIGSTDPNSTEDARGKTNGWALGAFVQDNWKVSGRLTLNYGIRWDAEINMLNNDYKVPWADQSKYPEIVANVPADYLNKGDRKSQALNLSPRFSFNYDLFDNNLTFLRGGAGIFYDRTFGQLGYFEWLYANWRMYTIQNPGTMDVSKLRQQILSGTGTSKPDLYLVDKNIELPRILNWSVGFSHQVTEDLAVSADYVWKHYERIYKAYDANYYVPSLKKRKISDAFGAMWLYTSMGDAEYYGILSSIIYRHEQAFAQLSYTLSWAYAENDGTTYTLQDLYRMQRSNLDERHRFVLNFSYDFPFDFKLSGIFTLASPTPYTRTVGQDINNDNNFGDDWVSGQRYDVPDANRIRNWYKMLDLRLAKYFDYANIRLGLMFEAFNVGNWFNASGYNGRMADANGNPLLTYGRPNGAYLPRTMQFGVRIFY